MEYRKTKKEDIDIVLSMYEDAKIRLKESGINQWQDGYPNKETLLVDMEAGESYVVIDNDKVVATCMISSQVDSNYSIIEGAWLDDNPYVVIHRVATDAKYLKKGYASYCFKIAKEEFPHINSIKIDTHLENIAMQKMLNKNGFMECGIVYVANNAKRIAFQKIEQ